MLPVVIFPDVEAWLVGYLRDQLAARSEPVTSDVYVSNAVPDKRHDRMVIVRRDGGQRLGPAHELARMSVRVWGATDEEVADLTAIVRALMSASPGVGPVRRAVEIAGPSRLIEESGQPVRFFTFEFIVRS